MLSAPSIVGQLEGWKRYSKSPRRLYRLRGLCCYLSHRSYPDRRCGRHALPSHLAHRPEPHEVRELWKILCTAEDGTAQEAGFRGRRDVEDLSRFSQEARRPKSGRKFGQARAKNHFSTMAFLHVPHLVEYNACYKSQDPQEKGDAHEPFKVAPAQCIWLPHIPGKDNVNTQ